MEGNGIWYIGLSKRKVYYIEENGRTIEKFSDKKGLREYLSEQSKSGKGIKLKFRRGVDVKTQRNLEGVLQ